MAQRGSQSIFASLFVDEIIDTATNTDRKGRSEDLINNRNELLFCRYYYYAKIIRKQYPDTLKLLRKELFLENRTIVDTIQRNSDYLQQLRQKTPDVKYFRTLYPWLVW